jgi:uncharacterized membrane protein YdfJ with MMPL/SSD domain
MGRLKMKDSEDKISKSLNINKKLSDSVSSTLAKIQEIETNIKKIDIVDQDYEETRQNLRDLIDMSKKTLESMLNLADGMENPKAYSVAAELLRTAIDANYRLMELHKLAKSTQNEKVQKATNITNNSIIVSNTKDVMEMIKQSKINKKEEDGSGKEKN